MNTIERVIDLNLPVGQSAFLWGARKTGKSTLIKQHYGISIVYGFLKTDLLLELTRPHPKRFSNCC